MNGVIVAQAPIRPGGNDAIAALKGSESEGSEHITLHATKHVNHAELQVPKGSLVA